VKFEVGDRVVHKASPTLTGTVMIKYTDSNSYQISWDHLPERISLVEGYKDGMLDGKDDAVTRMIKRRMKDEMGQANHEPLQDIEEEK